MKDINLKLYEPSDIDPKDKLSISITTLYGLLVIFQEGLASKAKAWDDDELVRQTVAVFLNTANAVGLSIAPKESVPAAFRNL